MMRTANELSVVDPDGTVRVVFLCEDHAAFLLRQTIGESPAPLS